jgi:hypothetical protein
MFEGLRPGENAGDAMVRMGLLRQSGWSRMLSYPDLPEEVEAIVDSFWPHDDVCHTKGCPGVGFCAFAQPVEGRSACTWTGCDCIRLSVAYLAQAVAATRGHSCPPDTVVRKFDGGRGALLCATCNVIVGWER